MEVVLVATSAFDRSDEVKRENALVEREEGAFSHYKRIIEL